MKHLNPEATPKIKITNEDDLTTEEAYEMLKAIGVPFTSDGEPIGIG